MDRGRVGFQALANGTHSATTRIGRGVSREETTVQTVTTEKNAADRGQSEPLIQKNRPVRILAKSIFRELKSQGYDDRQIVSLATELLSEVTDEMSRESTQPRPIARRA